MKPHIKKLWIDALRSGEYKQGKGYLRPWNDKYCCLGVLCDLHAKETGNRWEGMGADTYLGERSVLPEDVCQWAGLSDCAPFIMKNDDDKATYLDSLNDGGCSFNEIASLIEDNL